MKKTLSILLIFLCFICVSAQEDFKIKYGPYLQNVGENEATVVWVTSGNAFSWVELAPDDGSHFYAEERPQFFETVLGRKVVGTVHKITIRGLAAGTGYRYRIYSREVLDNTGWDTRFGKVAASNVYNAKPYRFKTLDSNKNQTSFVVFNDVHGNNERFENLFNQVKKGNPDFYIFNGDMVNQLTSQEQMFDHFLSKSIELFARETPFYYARGNHETRGAFSYDYMNYFPTSTGKPYYSFMDGPAFFIVLDGGEDKPDSDIEYGGLSAYDPYREEQAEWLKTVVSEKSFKDAPVKIVILHVPPASVGWHGQKELLRLFNPILNDAGINLMISGHTHRYSLVEKNKDGNNFPILINSNKEAVDVKVNGNNIDLKIIDEKGNVAKEFTF